MIPCIFQDHAVVICAGGPSLCGFDFSKLADLNVIAINRAHEFAPAARVLWWTDARYWRKAKESLAAHRAPYKATCQMEYRETETLPADIHVYRFTGLQGFDPDPTCLRHGNNGTYAAMHLAVHLGAKLIVLLGVDMKHAQDGRAHFHDGHGTLSKERTLTQLMLPHFRGLVAPLAQRGVAVLNASPNSALTLWRRCTIQEGLSAARSWPINFLTP